MKTKITLTLVLYSFLFSPLFWTGGGAEAYANNIYIQNVNFATPPYLTFQISWENSWYTTTGTNNWDAVWVFIKYQPCGSGTPASPAWEHAQVSSTPGDHTIACAASCAPVSLQIDPASDGMGIFIRGNNIASQFTNLWNVTLKITGTAATTCTASNSCNWKVFGIEMVNIPTATAPFSVGDGSATTTSPFNDGSGPPGAPVSISGAGAIGANGLFTGSPALGASYPKGYTGFYCMKYEISQEEYAGFLNTLTFDQQVSRVKMAPDSIYNFWALTTTTGGPYNRQGIKMSQQGVYNFVPAVYKCDLDNDNSYNQTTDGLHTPCNYLSWQDVAAFLDWAALRPMTELEYERVCRGTLGSVTDEFPWGTAADTTAGTSTMLANAGQTSEIIDTTLACSWLPYGWCNGLCVYGNTNANGGPVRVGQAARSNTTRSQAGAAYYGALDMAGNVWEQVVSVEGTGANYTGSLGDGVLTSTGNATNTDWPGIDATPANGITGADGSGSRGGSWYTQIANVKQLRTSDRTNASTPMSTRNAEYGGRGVR